MEYQAINFVQKFDLFDEQWQPKVITEMNDYQFKVVKLQGDFIWHHHKDTDETFIVIEGDLRIDFRDAAARVRAGENVRRSEGGGAQTVRRERSQVALDRAARRAQYRRCGWRADSGAGCLDLKATGPPIVRLCHSNNKAISGKKDTTRSRIILDPRTSSRRPRDDRFPLHPHGHCECNPFPANWP